MLKSLKIREITAAAICLLIGGLAGIHIERLTSNDHETLTLGLLLKSCIEDSCYERFTSSLQSPPIGPVGESGTDFENLYPTGQSGTYVAELTASKRSERGRAFYQIRYSMSDIIGRSTIGDFTVFLLDADDRSTLGVVAYKEWPPAESEESPAKE